MTTTQNYKLQLYDENEVANLIEGYNNSMETLDAVLKKLQDDVDSVSVSQLAAQLQSLSDGSIGVKPTTP